MEPSKKIGVLPLIISFFIVAVFLFVSADQLTVKHINVLVVQVANLLLFSFSTLNIYFQKKNINNPNPNAVIRGVMAGMLLKLFGLAAAAVIYLFAAGENRSVNAVFVGMGLYIIYTWLEVRISLRLNPKK